MSALVQEEEENKQHLDDERISINDEKDEEVKEAVIHNAYEKKNAKWHVTRKCTQTTKGIVTCIYVMKQNLKHDHYKCFLRQEIKMAQMNSIHNNNHQLYSIKLNKI